jgi:hypothetical protein
VEKIRVPQAEISTAGVIMEARIRELESASSISLSCNGMPPPSLLQNKTAKALSTDYTDFHRLTRKSVIHATAQRRNEFQIRGER